MFCVKCGSQNPDTNAFCTRCGAPLLTVPPQAPVRPTPQVEWTPAVPIEPLQDGETAPNADAQPDIPADVPFTPPYQPEYQPPVAPAKPAKPAKAPKEPRKPRPAPTGGTKALTAFLCIFFAIFFLISSGIGIVRNLLSEDTLESIIEETDLSNVMLNNDGEETPLVDFIYDNLTDDVKPIFRRGSIEDMLDSDEVREFVVDSLTGYTEFFTDDARLKPIDADTIVGFLDENSYELLDYPLSTKELNSIESALNRGFDFTSISKTGLSDTLGIDVKVLQFFLSPLGYGLSIALCVVFLALIVVANRKNIFACLPAVFVTLLVLGSLYLVVALACFCVTLFVDFWIIEMLNKLILTVATFFALRGAVAFVIGLAGVLIKRALSKRTVQE